MIVAPFTFDATLLSAHAPYNADCGVATVAVFEILVVEVSTGVDVKVVRINSMTIVVFIAAVDWS
jgi:hypothetical protein